MISRYYPNDYVEDVFSIDYNRLYDKGFRLLIFDIDNTLVPHGADSTHDIDRLFARLHDKGFKTMLLSNNNESRIKRFMKNIDTRYIAEADKPDPKSYLKALEITGIPKEKTVMIGDTTFTDIAGANAAGISSILVKYIGFYSKEKKGIRRNLERLILMMYSIFSNKSSLLRDAL